MKKSLLALVVAGSFVLAGCSSSGGVTGDNDATPQRPEPVDPGFGIGTEIERPSPDMGDTPDWGIVTPPADRPEPVDPDFGVQVPTQPPVDNTPDRPQPDSDDTPDWGVDSPVDRPEPVDPSWGISTDPEVSPAINSIDRNKVRDALRSRLNG